MVDDFCCSVRYKFASSHFRRGEVDDAVDGVCGRFACCEEVEGWA